MTITCPTFGGNYIPLRLSIRLALSNSNKNRQLILERDNERKKHLSKPYRIFKRFYF